MTRSFMPVLMVAAGLASFAVSLPVAAQFAKPEDAIRYRRGALTVMATHFGRVAAMANGKMPFDAKMVADNAEIATMMSKLPYVAFIEGTDKGDTKAKPEIWSEMDKFKAAAGKIPFDAKVAADNAETATMLSKLPYAGFIEGTDKGDTKAKAEIWTEPDKFKAAAAKMQEEMAKLNVAAKAGNLDAMKVAVGETGKQCKGCHDTYRKE